MSHCFTAATHRTHGAQLTLLPPALFRSADRDGSSLGKLTLALYWLSADGAPGAAACLPLVVACLPC